MFWKHWKVSKLKLIKISNCSSLTTGRRIVREKNKYLEKKSTFSKVKFLTKVNNLS